MGNQNSGMRPQPTVIKLLRGNPGKRKPNENEVRPPAGDIVKPAGLSAGAAGVWDALAPIHLAMGTLTVADVGAFAKLCELEASFAENTALKGTEAFNGRREIELAASVRAYYDMFGGNPSSRSRIAVPKKAVDEPISKWAGIK